MMKIDPILPFPDSIQAVENGAIITLAPSAENRWGSRFTLVTLQITGSEQSIAVECPHAALSSLHLRWRSHARHALRGCRLLGDAWERSSGDLEWRGIVPDRPMPWYFLAFNGVNTRGYGVKTGAGALCHWQVDTEGVSLWLDVRCGGEGVELGQRSLLAAVVVTAQSQAAEGPFAFACRFTRLLCAQPLKVKAPVYGANNWYYAYGISSPAEIVRDSQVTSDLAPDMDNRPYSVIDAGWQYTGSCYGSPWNIGNRDWPDMPLLAAQIAQTGCRPGIWYRPLLNNQLLPDGWTLSPQRFSTPNQPGTILDPSVPEVLEIIRQDMARFVAWGYQLVKHDFSTYDLFGQWEAQMGSSMTGDGWRFHDSTRTSAEIIGAFYRTLCQAAGENTVVIGCNTIGHLSAGLVHLQRIGADTSGLEWERTRKMGVNTLAFRASQHGAFFEADADCVGLTNQVPWELTRQWLHLLSRSGTPLFVSASPDALSPEVCTALKTAYTHAAKPAPLAEPLDWMETTTPARWSFAGEEVEYQWAL